MSKIDYENCEKTTPDMYCCMCPRMMDNKTATCDRFHYLKKKSVNMNG